MSKNFNNTDILIRNIDASILYRLGTDFEKVQEFRQLEKEYTKAKESGNNDLKKELRVKIRELKKGYINVMTKDKDVKLKQVQNRKLYRGSLNASLMRAELESQLSDKDKFTIGKVCGYTDIIINISFDNDYMVESGTAKYDYDPETDSMVESGKGYLKFKTADELRDMFYDCGVWINGRHYVDFQRSSSKARTGDCLFIAEEYADHMREWQRMGLNFKRVIQEPEQEVKRGRKKKPKYEEFDIVAIRAYESLTSSSIMTTVEIDPESILLIDDASGEYTMKCLVAKNVIGADGEPTEDIIMDFEDYTQKTDLWDGQSLLCSSVFQEGTYKIKNRKGKEKVLSLSDKGFLLLRNHFFKSAGFNTNLQGFYQSDEGKKYLKKRIDADGTEYYVTFDKYGKEMDTRKIKMVTTKNSVKILKEPFISCVLLDKKGYTHEQIAEMSNLQKEQIVWEWYKQNINSTFGVCKYEKGSKFNDGEWQQLAYQIYNSLNFTRQDLEGISEPMINHINLMKSENAFFVHDIDTRPTQQLGQSMMLQLLAVNDDVKYTKMYKEFRRSQIADKEKRIKKGKVLVPNTDYCVLFGNPYEMLIASAGAKIDSSIMDNPEHDKKNQYECYSPKFRTYDEDGKDIEKELYGFRNPHICSGNATYLVNVYHPEYQWFNMTDNILAVNFFGFGAFLSPKWNGCDVDSDAVVIGDEPTVLKRVKEVQDNEKYPIPINDVKHDPQNFAFLEENLATVDAKLSSNLIGRVCNIGQWLQSYYWTVVNTGTEEQKERLLPQIYSDVAYCEILSNIFIDSAKRVYKIDPGKEISKILNREYLIKEGEILEGEAIKTEYVSTRCNLSESMKQEWEKQKAKLEMETDPEKIKTLEDKIRWYEQRSKTITKKPDFMKLNSKSVAPKKPPKGASEEEKQKYKEALAEYKKVQDMTYYVFDTPMDILGQIVDDNKGTIRTSKTISIMDILNKTKVGKKVDYRKVERAIKYILEVQSKICALRAELKEHKISKEEFYNQKKNIELDAINTYSNDFSFSEYEIYTLFKKVYDEHPLLDTHGKVVMKDEVGEDGKKIIYKGGKNKGKVKQKPVMTDNRDARLLEAKCGSMMLKFIFHAHRNVFLSLFRSCNNSEVERVRLVENPQDYEKIYKLYDKYYVIEKVKVEDLEYENTEEIIDLESEEIA